MSDLSEAKANGNFLLLAALTIVVVALGYQLRWGFLRPIAAFMGFWSPIYVDVAAPCSLGDPNRGGTPPLWAICLLVYACSPCSFSRPVHRFCYPYLRELVPLIYRG